MPAAILLLAASTPLLFALLVALLPEARTRLVSFFGTMVSLAFTGYACLMFDWENGGTMQLTGTWAWWPEIGLNLSVGVDSVSLLLIALTSLLGPICVAASTTAITTKVKTFHFWLLVLQTAMAGVFASRDLLLFYICFEFTLLPMYVLISLFGSSNRAKAATKFFLYTFTGSMVALAGLVYVVWFTNKITGDWTLDIGVLQSVARRMSLGEQSLVLGAMLLGFGVKVPLFPVHTWLPLAHTEAPTAGSVILAGVLLKLGTYGIYRFVLPMAPDAVLEYAPLLAILSIVGILYAGLICWVQTDVKKLVAYSSVSHLGFCVLGLVALNPIGMTGSVLYMINHGLSTGALFLLIGMVYERYHTRSMRELGGLASKMPVWTFFMVFFTLASVGLPGLNGFVSEFMCLVGTFQSDVNWAQHGDLPGATTGRLGFWYAVAAGAGMVVAAMYLLYMVGKICWGELREPHGHDGHGDHDAHALPADLSRREVGVLLPLAALCLFLGVYPKPVIDAVTPSVREAQRLVGFSLEALEKQSASPTHDAGHGDPAQGEPEHGAPENDEPASTPAEDHQ